jgi:hypothetical protein
MTDEDIKECAKVVEETQSFRMLKDCLFFINSIGKQEDLLDHIPKADRELYLSVWELKND